MKQFIDKLIERLEAIEEHCLDMHDWQGQSAIVEAKEIVNQLAEEYKNKLVGIDTYMQVAHERDIAIEQLHELGYEFGEDINIQTIDVSELLGAQGCKVEEPHD